MTKGLCRFTLTIMLLAFVLHSVIFAQDVLLPGDESSPTFYEASLGSDDVSLFLSGSWKAELSASTGFGWTSDGGFSSEISYPNITGGVTFSQAPDLTISLIILEKLLFESAFTDEFADSTFMLGYIGSRDEFVRSVYTGNMGINLSEETEMSDYFYIPGGGPSSFGIRGLFAGPFSEHEVLFRFDPDEQLRKLYIGSDILVEIEKDPSDFVRGRLFFIPDKPSDAVFYIESSSDNFDINYDARYFRKMDADEYTYSTVSGRLFIADETNGATILVYSASAVWPDDMIVLYEPGIFSEFEALSAYELESTLPDDEWKTRAFLSGSPESASSGLEISTEVLADEGIVILGPSTGGTDQYPLEGVLPYPDRVYGAQALSVTDTSEKKLYFRIRETASGYSVDNPVEGSIRIYINGIETKAWSESGGTITFDKAPGNADRIEIVYRKNTGAEGGDIIFASANRFYPSEEWTADLNVGARWNLSDNYAVPGEETSSYGGISAGISYKNQREDDQALQIDAEIRGGLKLLTENSAGNLLLKGMNESCLDVTLTRNTVFPASLSSNIAAIDGLTAADRGLLIYKDYRLKSGIDNYYLQDYTTEITDDLVFSPDGSTSADKFKAGPYTASAVSDERTDEIVVMDYSLPAGGSWAGIQIPLNTAAGNIDLSAGSALSFDYKTDVSDLGNMDFYVEIGSISEDLDGDGKLDAETSEYSSGFIFNDPNSEAGTLIGGANLTGNNAQLDTEDFNDNGFIDHDKPDAIVLFEDITKPESDWKRLRLYFTDIANDSAARSRLKNAEFIRITAVNKSTGNQNGRIMFGRFKVEGVSFSAFSEPPYTMPELTEIDETMVPTSEKASSYLSSPAIDNTSDNRVLRVEWEDDWKIYSYLSPVAVGDYGSVVFNFYSPALTAASGESPELVFNLTDSTGKGLNAVVPFSSGREWHKVKLSMPTAGEAASVEVDEQKVEGASITFDAGASDLVLTEISVTGTDSGLIYIDELYLSDPVVRTSGGISVGFDIEYEKPLLIVGGMEVIGPLKMTNDASAEVTAGTDGLFSGSPGINYHTDLTFSLLGADVDTDFSIKGPEDIYMAGGHSIKIPIRVAGLVISDIFHTDNSDDGDFLKTNTFDFDAGVFSVGAGFSAALDSGLLNREWTPSAGISTDIFNMDLSADFFLSDEGTTFDRSDYFGSWYSASSLAANFSAAELVQRKSLFDLAASVTGNVTGIKADAELFSDVTDDDEATSGAEIALGLPFSFGEGISRINTELSYIRSAEFEFESTSDGFNTDIPQMFSTIGTGGILYSSVPVYELFSIDLPATLFSRCGENGINSSVFGNEIRFSLSRDYSSRLTDLFLPYTFNAGLKREVVKDYEDLEDEMIFDLVWRSAALNLFGAAGAYPVFKFYFSDELNWSIETKITDPFTSETSAETLIKNGLSIFGHREDIFSVDVSFYLPYNINKTTSNGNTSLVYIWNLNNVAPLDLPLYTAEEESHQIITNEERLSFTFDEDFSTEVKHTISLILPGRLTLSAFGLLGYQYTKDNKTSLFGLSLGLSGSIIY